MPKKVASVIVIAIVAAALIAVVTRSTGVHASDGAAEGGNKSAHLAALKAIPANASVVATLDVRSLALESLRQLGTLIGATGSDDDTLNAMGELLQRRVGLDPLRPGPVTTFAFRQNFAALMAADAPLPESDGPSQRHGDVTISHIPHGLWAARVGDYTVIGSLKAVELAIDCATGAASPLAETEPGALHRELLGELPDSDVIVTAGGPGLETLNRRVEGLGLRGVGFSLSPASGTRLVVKATEAGRRFMLQKVEQGKAMGKAALGMAMIKLGQLDVPEALGVLYANDHFDDIARMLQPKTHGDYLSLSIEGEGGAGIIVSMGVLSAVAIPAFIKYIRRARTTEAIDQLDKIYKGAAMYYISPRINPRTGEKLPCQFPADQGLTPQVGTCCASLGGPDSDHDDRCDFNPDEWNTPTWSALAFQIGGQHQFVYTFDSNGETGPEAQFTATAYGDLDCDGVMSTFQRMGFGDPSATAGDCSFQGSAAFYVENETE